MDVRLAYNPGPINAYGVLDHASMGDPAFTGALGSVEVDGPSVRLAVQVNGGGSLKSSNIEAALNHPTYRLAVTGDEGKERIRDNCIGIPEVRVKKEGDSPSVRLAHVPGAQGDNNLLGQRGVGILPPESKPALLVSYFYLDPFLKHKHRYAYRDWVMDSGAFSAFNSGATVDLQAYIETCKRLAAEDPTLTEVFALDVIGDHKASLKNCETMWKAGVAAIPCYHYGEPEDVLKVMARDYPKIALGGVARKRLKLKNDWAAQCFARVWPKKVHGFGFGSERSILDLPFHSVDASSWELAPCGFGNWATYGKLQVRGSNQDLRVEVEYYLRLEARARQRWKKEMALLEGQGPDVRLAVLCDTSEARYRALEPRKSTEEGRT